MYTSNKDKKALPLPPKHLKWLRIIIIIVAIVMLLNAAFIFNSVILVSRFIGGSSYWLADLYFAAFVLQIISLLLVIAGIGLYRPTLQLIGFICTTVLAQIFGCSIVGIYTLAFYVIGVKGTFEEMGLIHVVFILLFVGDMFTSIAVFAFYSNNRLRNKCIQTYPPIWPNSEQTIQSN